jgi:N-methylhydantoinase A
VRLDNAAAYQRIDSLFHEIEAKGVSPISKADGFCRRRDRHQALDRHALCRPGARMHRRYRRLRRSTGRTIDQVKDAFHARHEELYTYAERHSAVEVVNLESTVYGLIEKVRPPKLAEGGEHGSRP